MRGPFAPKLRELGLKKLIAVMRRIEASRISPARSPAELTRVRIRFRIRKRGACANEMGYAGRIDAGAGGLRRIGDNGLRKREFLFNVGDAPIAEQARSIRAGRARRRRRYVAVARRQGCWTPGSPSFPTRLSRHNGVIGPGGVEGGDRQTLKPTVQGIDPRQGRFDPTVKRRRDWRCSSVSSASAIFSVSTPSRSSRGPIKTTEAVASSRGKRSLFRTPKWSFILFNERRKMFDERDPKRRLQSPRARSMRQASEQKTPPGTPAALCPENRVLEEKLISPSAATIVAMFQAPTRQITQQKTYIV